LPCLPSVDKNGEYKDKILVIEDYGKISDSGFIELLFRRWNTTDIEFKEHLLKRLAKRLGVKLRDKPLTNEEELNLSVQNLKKFEEENKEWLEGFKDEIKTI